MRLSYEPGFSSNCCPAALHAHLFCGWCRDSFVELVERLYIPNRAQARALLATYAGSGHIGRATVLKLLKRGMRSRLGGWIEPINSVVVSMKREGSLPLHAVPPLIPKRDDDRSPIYAYELAEPLLYLLWHECDCAAEPSSAERHPAERTFRQHSPG